MARVLTSLLLVAFAGCAAPPPVATPFDAERAHVALADLQVGRTELVHKCSGCHRTPLPSEHVRFDWPKQLDEMSDRAHLDARERRLIETYLVAMAPN